jgi:arsenate reductase
MMAYHMRILVLCTGNSARSQMAAAILQAIDPTLDVQSAGTRPAERVHEKAIQVLAEIGVDISSNRPKSVETVLDQAFDYVITVCDQAKESCPVFAGRVRHRRHMGFEDPAAAAGTDAERLAVFRRIRDEISTRFQQFYRDELSAVES